MNPSETRLESSATCIFNMHNMQSPRGTTPFADERRDAASRSGSPRSRRCSISPKHATRIMMSQGNGLTPDAV